jgi:hypothetical protein
MKIPASIKNKIKSYAVHMQKAEENRLEVEEWLKNNGIDTDAEDLKEGAILDIIVDVGIDGDFERAIELIEKELNS